MTERLVCDRMSVLQENGGRGAVNTRPPDTDRTELPMPPHSTPEERFWSKVEKTPTCWLWHGATDTKGYGHVWVGRRGEDTWRQVRAHRLAYELKVGPIPEGMTLDHLCRNRICVNPEHLEPVTLRENILRGDSIAARHALMTHCPQGHAYDLFNTYFRPSGARACRLCRALYSRIYERARKKRQRGRC